MFSQTCNFKRNSLFGSIYHFALFFRLENITLQMKVHYIYRTFDFSVWINNQSPVIISSIDPGTSTKDVITINYNPGLIYTQIGKGYITLDDQKIVDINSESISFVDTITISDRGEHWLKIFSEDGKLIGSYKFTKAEPMNGITKFVIIGIVIAIVVVAVLFLLLRRKGKYR